MRTVYPRVGGANVRPHSHVERARGLSPRGRGKHGGPAAAPAAHGSIPAWAGQTFALTLTSNVPGVYPRVGGANTAAQLLRLLPTGLSPRGRGKPSRLPGFHRSGWSIPAWAGQTILTDDERAAFAVYPRVGGANIRGNHIPERLPGLSPRGRGKRSRRFSAHSSSRSIPAWAGQTVHSCADPLLARVYPRVGGANWVGAGCLPSSAGLSPRGRGKLGAALGSYISRRSIPAWAGQTRGKPTASPPIGVYPRVGGANNSRNPARSNP